MSSQKDVFGRHQATIDRVKAVGNLDVFGNPKPKLPCDVMATFRIEDCKTCPSRGKCGGECGVV